MDISSCCVFPSGHHLFLFVAQPHMAPELILPTQHNYFWVHIQPRLQQAQTLPNVRSDFHPTPQNSPRNCRILNMDSSWLRVWHIAVSQGTVTAAVITCVLQTILSQTSWSFSPFTQVLCITPFLHSSLFLSLVLSQNSKRKHRGKLYGISLGNDFMI